MLALVLGVSLLVGWMGRPPELGTGEDEAVYLLLSNALADGHYRDMHVPGAPLHAKYPPGTSVWILLVRAVAGGSLDAVRAGNLALIVLAGFLLADGWRRLGNPWLGIGAAAITVWNPFLLLIGTTLSSEPLFIAVSVGAVWATLRVPIRRGTRWAVVVGGLAIAGFLTRIAGIGLVAGIGCWGLAQKRWRFVAAFGTLAGAVVLGWFQYLSSAMAVTVAQTYAVDMPGGVNPEFVNLAHSAFTYTATIVPYLLGLPTVPNTVVDNLVHMMMLLGAGVTGTWLILKRWPAGGWTLLASSGVLIVWSWASERLVLPLLPWIGSSVLVGTMFIASKLPSRIGRALPIGLCVALASLALTGSVQRVAASRACSVPDQYALASCARPGERALVQAARALRDSGPSGTTLVTTKPSTVHFFSGRTVFPLEVYYRSGRLLQTLSDEGPSGEGLLMLLTQLTPLERNLVAPILLQHCRRLEVADRFGLGALLLRVPARQGTANACEALEEYSREFPASPD